MFLSKRGVHIYSWLHEKISSFWKFFKTFSCCIEWEPGMYTCWSVHVEARTFIAGIRALYWYSSYNINSLLLFHKLFMWSFSSVIFNYCCMNINLFLSLTYLQLLSQYPFTLPSWLLSAPSALPHPYSQLYPPSLTSVFTASRLFACSSKERLYSLWLIAQQVSLLSSVPSCSFEVYPPPQVMK